MAKDDLNNRKYTKEEKDRLIARMLPPESISPTNLSIETGISKSTLATWKSKATGGWASKTKKSTRNMSSKEKFLIVMETYTLSETDFSKYCRENGLYVEQVKNWRASCIAANNNNKKNSEELEMQLIEEKKKTKELSKDLRMKEKVLAETTALLVLRKKLNAIFEEDKED